ncbi:MAG: type II toxin-antitoxin system VapC family toxin [Acidimicrobiales bacterium]
MRREPPSADVAWYVDTSAFLKLVVEEEHSGAFRTWAEANDESLFSSDLMRVEALRSANRHSPSALAATRQRLDAIALLAVTRAAYDMAVELSPAILRTLDALHLAVALGIGDELDGVVTYDDRLASAVASHGVTAVMPT